MWQLWWPPFSTLFLLVSHIPVTKTAWQSFRLLFMEKENKRDMKLYKITASFYCHHSSFHHRHLLTLPTYFTWFFFPLSSPWSQGSVRGLWVTDGLHWCFIKLIWYRSERDGETLCNMLTFALAWLPTCSPSHADTNTPMDWPRLFYL